MSFYRYTHDEVMTLPVRMLWILNNTATRLMAERDSRWLDVAISAQSAEGYKTMKERLSDEMGDVIKVSGSYLLEMRSKRDEEGVAALKAMAGKSGGRKA